MNTQEIECRFLEIDKEALIKKLNELGAADSDEEMVEETIFYDQELKWRDEQKFTRLRKTGGQTKLTFKDQKVQTIDGTFELEVTIDDYQKGLLLLEKIGLLPYRQQQKKRHSFTLNNVTVDIDTWPNIPTYVELEGESESDLKAAAELLDLDWNKADFHNARWVIENVYGVPVGNYRLFTFAKCE